MEQFSVKISHETLLIKLKSGVWGSGQGRPWGKPVGSFTHPELHPHTVEAVGECSFRLQARRHFQAYSDLWDYLQCVEFTPYLCRNRVWLFLAKGSSPLCRGMVTSVAVRISGHQLDRFETYYTRYAACWKTLFNLEGCRARRTGENCL